MGSANSKAAYAVLTLQAAHTLLDLSTWSLCKCFAADDRLATREWATIGVGFYQRALIGAAIRMLSM